MPCFFVLRFVKRLKMLLTRGQRLPAFLPGYRACCFALRFVSAGTTASL